MRVCVGVCVFAAAALTVEIKLNKSDNLNGMHVNITEYFKNHVNF